MGVATGITAGVGAGAGGMTGGIGAAGGNGGASGGAITGGGGAVGMGVAATTGDGRPGWSSGGGPPMPMTGVGAGTGGGRPASPIGGPPGGIGDGGGGPRDSCAFCARYAFLAARSFASSFRPRKLGPLYGTATPHFTYDSAVGNILTQEQAPSCGCGCGRPVTQNKQHPDRWNQFIHGHNVFSQKTVLERLAEKSVTTDTGCLVWTGHCSEYRVVTRQVWTHI